MDTNRHNDIAIIGLAGHFPGAASVEDLWENLNNKIDSVKKFSVEECIASGVPENLAMHPNYVPSKGYLDKADYFDADFFKFSQNDAEIMDPQFRILFEISWEALENAGYIPETYPGKIGVFVGSSMVDTYFHHNLVQPGYTLFSDNFTLMLHNAKDFLPSLLAYKLNLRGPSVAVQTACSTSLVSVCMASQSILSGESDMAIAGGTCVTAPLKSGHLFQEGMMLSPTGTCNTFDRKANGIVLGNGAGIIVLKRLDKALTDGDTIHAIIKGFAVNNDGNARIGFTAPGVLGQQAVVQASLENAGITPEQISYIETHGTGTILGDLIEIQALNKVFATCKKNSISIGSVKPNIGHLDAAAGIANLIKVILALKHKTLPPNIHFDHPSPQLKLDETPFRVNTTSQPWESDAPRYASTSSFGMGGINAHVVLTEALQHPSHSNSEQPVILLLSARSETALKKMCQNLATYLQNHPEINLIDVAYTLQVGRKSFKHRMAFQVDTVEKAVQKLKQHANDTIHEEPFSSWIAGKDVNWEKENGHKIRRRIPLPTYCFEPHRYWTTRDQLQLPKYKSVSKNTKKNDRIEKEKVIAVVKEIYEKFLIQKNINLEANFESLGGESLTAILITHEINQTLQVKIPFSIISNNLSVKTLSEHIVSHIENQDVIEEQKK